MLRIEGEKSAWFLLIGGKPCLYADGVGRSIQQPCISPTMFRPSGISELAPLRRHPESVPAVPMCVSPLGLSTGAGWSVCVSSRSTLTAFIKNSPPRCPKYLTGSVQKCKYDFTSLTFTSTTSDCWCKDRKNN
jgi:hypothetical protein